LLSIESLFGELVEHDWFVDVVKRWLALLYDIGAKATLEHARRALNF
jgi:hypothetical protein